MEKINLNNENEKSTAKSKINKKQEMKIWKK